MNTLTSTFLSQKQQLHDFLHHTVGNSINSTDFLAQKRAKEFTGNLFTVEISGSTAGGRLEALKLRYTGLSSLNTLNIGTKCTWGCTCMYIKRRTQFHLVFFGAECRSVSSSHKQKPNFLTSNYQLQTLWFDLEVNMRTASTSIVHVYSMGPGVPPNFKKFRTRPAGVNVTSSSLVSRQVTTVRAAAVRLTSSRVGVIPSVWKHIKDIHNPPTTLWLNW